MELITVTNVNQKEWESLQKKYGDGKVDPLGWYEDLDTADYAGFEVVLGKMKQSGSDQIVPTRTGYLRFGTRVDGSVQFDKP